MQFTLKELFVAGGVVFIFLIILSIYSLAIIIEKWKKFKENEKNFKEIKNKFNFFIKSNDFKNFEDFLSKKNNLSSEIILRIIKHTGSNIEKREFSEKLIEYYINELSKKLNGLATIGSTTPFIGLFGTVIGVIRAFRDLSSFQAAGPSVVASGIAEALVNTAAGLFVAVPAIIAYNYFISKVNRISTEINVISEQIIEKQITKENIK